MTSYKRFNMPSRLILMSVLALSLPMYAAAQSVNNGQSVQISSQNSSGAGGVNVASGFSKFTPRPNGKIRKLDYRVFDEALAQVVVDLGPSTRIWQRRPDAEVGTRIITGHVSPFRLEGKRFTFSYINEEYKTGLTAYREDLEALATQHDITKFPKKEQLVFWLNLHNVAVIEQIALDYPTKRPRNIKIKTAQGTQKLNEAKFLNIKGQALSLRDIRENIVYANWKNPNVMYGFFRGDIGSPSIQEYAFTADRLDYMLDSNANDFVNSLRGYRKAGGKGKVSEIYKTDGRFFFSNWQDDVKRHLLTHANETLEPEILRLTEFTTAPYSAIVADLAGGGTERTRNLAVQGSNPFSDANKNLPPEIARILQETANKYRILQQRGVVGRIQNGTVIIEDVETVDPDEEGSLTGNP